jgi:hypothetical protein
MYTESVLAEPFSTFTHFPDNQKSWPFSYSYPCHFSQDRLSEKLVSSNVVYGQSYANHQELQDHVVVKT